MRLLTSTATSVVASMILVPSAFAEEVPNLEAGNRYSVAEGWCSEFLGTKEVPERVQRCRSTFLEACGSDSGECGSEGTFTFADGVVTPVWIDLVEAKIGGVTMRSRGYDCWHEGGEGIGFCFSRYC